MKLGAHLNVVVEPTTHRWRCPSCGQSWPSVFEITKKCERPKETKK